MLRLNETVAEEIGVVPDVHQKDFIYWFCCMHPNLPLEYAINYYFRDGANSAAKIAELISTFADLDTSSVKLLEFASGYGCVSRHLKKYPRIDLVSCDIHAEAIEFLKDRIGVKAHQSAHVPEQFSAPETYDVVFALSFFSHMPKSSFGRWLRTLFQALRTPGYLIFTTHGLKSGEPIGITPQDIPADGFWFAKKSEQHDLEVEEYGLTVTTPDYVIGELYRQTGAPIVAYKHAHRWDHQDLWVVKRER
jgi:hypothetical protein